MERDIGDDGIANPKSKIGNHVCNTISVLIRLVFLTSNYFISAIDPMHY